MDGLSPPQNTMNLEVPDNFWSTALWDDQPAVDSEVHEAPFAFDPPHTPPPMMDAGVLEDAQDVPLAMTGNGESPCHEASETSDFA